MLTMRQADRINTIKKDIQSDIDKPWTVPMPGTQQNKIEAVKKLTTIQLDHDQKTAYEVISLFHTGGFGSVINYLSKK